ncbi:methyl-accepting chemotaxis protein [Neobacillus sp. LXY-1]|uniref:methyl-accepting chemotaxis protein n=1 Tax=Neobacillus sp. LXY-1 TaxID=3379133 RepID=UPI003EE09EB0
MKMTIRKKLQGGFITVLIILAIQSVVSYYQISSINNSYTDLVDDKGKKLVMIKSLENAAKDEQVNLQSYLFTGDEQVLQKYYFAVENYKNYSGDLAKVIKTPKAKKLLNELDSIENDYRDFAENAISLKKTNEEAFKLLNFQHGTDIINQLSDKTIEFSHFQQSLLDNGQADAESGVASVKMVVLVLSIISIVAGLAISYIIGQKISKPLIFLKKAAEKIASGDLTDEEIKIKNKDEIGELADSFNQMTGNLRDLLQQVSMNANQVTATSEELSASAEETRISSQQITQSIQEVASGVERQFISIEETTRTIRELAVGVHQIANNSQVVTNTANEASEKASNGGESIHTAIEQMKSINQTVHGLSEVISNLGSRSQEINQIIEVITNISAQTNLLALNAAIEAARAGEHGRGFSVVADEVRKLAEQSTTSAQQIAKLIKGIQGETHQAMESMEGAKTEVSEGLEVISSAGALFAQIQTAVTNVADQIHEVSAAVQQMAAGSEQMSQSMKHISEIGEQAASGSQEVSAATSQQLVSMEEITSSALSLAKMSEKLQTLIGKFKV